MDEWKWVSWSGNLFFKEAVLNSELRAGHVRRSWSGYSCTAWNVKLWVWNSSAQLPVASWGKISSLRRGVYRESKVRLLLSPPGQSEARRRRFGKGHRPAGGGGKIVVSSVRGRLLRSKEMTFKKGKGVNGVKWGREGRHLWTIHIFYFLFYTINYH